MSDEEKISFPDPISSDPAVRARWRDTALPRGYVIGQLDSKLRVDAGIGFLLFPASFLDYGGHSTELLRAVSAVESESVWLDAFLSLNPFENVRALTSSHSQFTLQVSDVPFQEFCLVAERVLAILTRLVSHVNDQYLTEMLDRSEYAFMKELCDKNSHSVSIADAFGDQVERVQDEVERIQKMIRIRN